MSNNSARVKIIEGTIDNNGYLSFDEYKLSYSGENKYSRLEITVPEVLLTGYILYIEAVLPVGSGTKFISKQLTFDADDKLIWDVPYTVAKYEGNIGIQVVAYSSDSAIFKSSTVTMTIDKSVEASEDDEYFNGSAINELYDTKFDNPTNIASAVVGRTYSLQKDSNGFSLVVGGGGGGGSGEVEVTLISVDLLEADWTLNDLTNKYEVTISNSDIELTSRITIKVDDDNYEASLDAGLSSEAILEAGLVKLVADSIPSTTITVYLEIMSTTATYSSASVVNNGSEENRILNSLADAIDEAVANVYGE